MIFNQFPKKRGAVGWSEDFVLSRGLSISRAKFGCGGVIKMLTSPDILRILDKGTLCKRYLA